MTDAPNNALNPDQVLGPGETDGLAPAEATDADYVSQPAKVMRIGSMVKTLLDEARTSPLDEAGRARLREIYETSVRELSDALSPDLSSELSRMALPFTGEVPSDSELRIAQAQLVGWLEGLFHGIQASLFAQQAAAAAWSSRRSANSAKAHQARRLNPFCGNRAALRSSTCCALPHS